MKIIFHEGRMKQKVKRFIPTVADKEWLTDMYHQLEDGSQLITDVATYQMSNRTFVLKKINDLAYQADFDALTIEKEIDKMRATADAIEVRFFDARPEKSN